MSRFETMKQLRIYEQKNENQLLVFNILFLVTGYRLPVTDF